MDPMESSIGLILAVFSAVLGAIVGSFLNVCIYRLPREGLSILRPPRSFCPSCGARIAGCDNLPILSWLLLGGRCRTCRAPISVRYLLVEGLSALLFLILARRYLSGQDRSWGEYFALATLVSLLIVASFIDLDLRIIPDGITLPGMAAAPFVALIAPGLHVRQKDSLIVWFLQAARTKVAPIASGLPQAVREGPALIAVVGAAAAISFLAGLFGSALYFRAAHPGAPRPLSANYLGGVLGGGVGAMAVYHALRPESLLLPQAHSFWAALAGMFAGSTLVFLAGVLGSWAFRKPAMGFGDVKLMGLLGAFTGWVGVVAGFFIACFAGSVVGIFLLLKYKSRYLPFGPFLALGCLAMILWPEVFRGIFSWYMGLF